MIRKSLRISVFSLLIISCCLITTTYAGSFSKDSAGTTGAQFLKIGCGARAIGMGEAFSSVVDDASAIYWNPAGLSQIEGGETSAMHAIWLEDISYDYLAYAQPLMKGSIGASVNYLSMSKMDKLDENGDKDGTFRPYDVAFNLAYAQKVGSITGGVNVKFITQGIDGETGSAFALDLGTLHNLSNRIQGAIVVQNIGSRIKFIEKSYALPLSIRLGLSCKLGEKFVLALDGVAPIDNDPNLHVGCEYVLDVIKSVAIALRLGYKTTTTSDLDALSGLSAGLGFNIKGLNVDYAWVPYGDLGYTHRISLGIKFAGGTERNIVRMEKYYMKGVEFYRAGEYELAISQFNEVLKIEPNHTQSKTMITKAKAKLVKVNSK